MPFIYLLISFAVANAVIIYICLTVALIVASLLCIVGCVMDFLFSSCCYFFFFFFSEEIGWLLVFRTKTLRPVCLLFVEFLGIRCKVRSKKRKLKG